LALVNDKLSTRFAILKKFIAFFAKYLVVSPKDCNFAPFFDDACSQGKQETLDAHTLARTKNVINRFPLGIRKTVLVYLKERN